MNLVFSIIAGYMLGSFLPAYFLTLWLKGVDIRTVGTRHAGTTNVKRNVGLWAAAVTAAYDTTKGILATTLALELFDVPPHLSYLSGFAAVVGHVFPFYLDFKGGKGVATSTGLLIMLLGKLSLFYWRPSWLIPDLIFMIFFVLMIYFTTRDENFLALCVLPALAALLTIRMPLIWELWYVLAIIGYIFVVSANNMRKLGIIERDDENLRLWRVFIRPAAMAFPIILLTTSREFAITLSGSVLALSFTVDAIRVSWDKAEKFFARRFFGSFAVYKQKERKRISSITTFLMGVFFSFLLFPATVAVTSIGILVFGDMLAKIVGISYGRKKLFNKTLEGSLGFLTAAAAVSYLLSMLGLVSFFPSLLAAAAATVVEVLPFPIDDNLSVPIVSGALLELIQFLR